MKLKTALASLIGFAAASSCSRTEAAAPVRHEARAPAVSADEPMRAMNDEQNQNKQIGTLLAQAGTGTGTTGTGGTVPGTAPTTRPGAPRRSRKLGRLAPRALAPEAVLERRRWVLAAARARLSRDRRMAQVVSRPRLVAAQAARAVAPAARAVAPAARAVAPAAWAAGQEAWAVALVAAVAPAREPVPAAVLAVSDAFASPSDRPL